MDENKNSTETLIQSLVNTIKLDFGLSPKELFCLSEATPSLCCEGGSEGDLG